VAQSGRQQRRGALAGYLADSRNPLNTVLLLLPLFLIYSVGILATGGVRSGVDLVSDLLRRHVFASDTQYLIFHLGSALAFVLAALWLRHRHCFRPSIYLLVVLEGALYGLLLGQGVPRLLALLRVSPDSAHLAAAAADPLAQLGTLDRFVLSLGAGLWEELVFRLLLLGGTLYLLVRVLRLPPLACWIAAALFSSLAFSTVHYLGNLADTFQLYGFLFRFLAGMVFALVYALRGLAVSVYTHAVYDVMVLVVLA